MKKLLAVIFSVGILISISCAYAYAPCEFSDVSDTNSYIESIKMLASRGVIGGIGNGRFAPDRQLTGMELQIMLARLYTGGDINALPLSATCQETFGSDAINWAAATEAAICAAGIQVYSHEVFESPAYQNDYMNAAAIMGLYQTPPDALSALTRAECTDFLYKLSTTALTAAPAPLARFQSILIEDGQDTYVLRNQVAREAEAIPDHLIHRFNDAGFSLILSNSVSKYSTHQLPDNTILAGKTLIGNDNNRVIVFPFFWQNETAFYHEFGHAMAAAYSFSEKGVLQSIWASDAKNAFVLTSDQQSRQNPEECWACIFSYLMYHKDDTAKMAEAQSLTPSAYYYFEEIMAIPAIESN